jgi:hypothetical protein
MTADKDKPLAPVPDDERERRVTELDRELSGEEAREQAREPGSTAGASD